MNFVVDNLPIRTLWPPWEVMFSEKNITRPLAGWSFALSYALSELQPWGFHLLNIAVHLAAGLTLFGWVRRTLRLPLAAKAGLPRWLAADAPVFCDAFAASVALTFVLHPLQTQAVTYVVQRQESMMGLFFLGSLYASTRAAGCALVRPGRPSAREWSWVAATGVCAILGAGCKQVIAAAPLVLLAYDRVFVLPAFERKGIHWWRRLPLWLATMLCWPALALLLAQAKLERSTGLTALETTPWQYLLTQAGVIVHYVKLFFWPDRLAFDYMDWRVVTGLGEALPQAPLVLAICCAAGWGVWRRQAWGFCVAAFFLILAPSSSVLPIQDVAFEHRTYLSLAMLGALTIGSVLRLAEDRVPAVVVAALLVPWLGGLGVRTFARNADYASREALWRSVVAARPQNPRAHHALGDAYAEGIPPGVAPDHARAIAHYRRAIALKRDYVLAYNNLGLVLEREGNLDEAQRVFLEGSRYDQTSVNHITILTSYANALDRAALKLPPAAREEKLNEAMEVLLRAERLEPRSHLVQHFIGNVLYDLKSVDGAKERYRKAIALNPEHAESRVNLGVILAQAGEMAAAAEQFATAVRLRPHSADGLFNLGLACVQLERYEDAVAPLQRLLALPKLDAGHTSAYLQLGIALAETGRSGEAVRMLEQALEANPSDRYLAPAYLAWLKASGRDPAVRDAPGALGIAQRAVTAGGSRAVPNAALAAALAAAGRFSEAIAACEKALAILRAETNRRPRMEAWLVRALEAYRAGRVVEK